MLFRMRYSRLIGSWTNMTTTDPSHHGSFPFPPTAASPSAAPPLFPLNPASGDGPTRVGDPFGGPIDEAPYFANYERQVMPWRLAVANVDGELAVLVMHQHEDVWSPYSVARLEIIDRHIARIVDYAHCP